MKSLRFGAVLVGSALLFGGNVFAGPASSKKTIHLPEAVVIDGKKLAPGEYKVEWSEPGPNVRVTILQGKTTIATVQARLLSLNVVQIGNSYSTSTASDGSKSLTQIYFAGTKSALDLGAASAAAGAQSAESGRPN
jgi:hypothetical protein